MTNTQYQLIEIKTGKVKGFLIGKTPECELVIQSGTRVWKLKITPAMELKYRVDAVQFSA